MGGQAAEAIGISGYTPCGRKASTILLESSHKCTGFLQPDRRIDDVDTECRGRVDLASDSVYWKVQRRYFRRLSNWTALRILAP